MEGLTFKYPYPARSFGPDVSSTAKIGMRCHYAVRESDIGGSDLVIGKGAAILSRNQFSWLRPLVMPSQAITECTRTNRAEDYERYLTLLRDEKPVQTNTTLWDICISAGKGIEKIGADTFITSLPDLLLSSVFTSTLVLRDFFEYENLLKELSGPSRIDVLTRAVRQPFLEQILAMGNRITSNKHPYVILLSWLKTNDPASYEEWKPKLNPVERKHLSAIEENGLLNFLE